MDEMNVIEERQKIIDRNPFCKMKIDESSVLDTVDGRTICGKCYKSRKFFCYTCYTPVIDQKYIPQVKVTFKLICNSYTFFISQKIRLFIAFHVFDEVIPGGPAERKLYASPLELLS